MRQLFLFFLILFSVFGVLAETSLTEQQWLGFVSRPYKPGIIPRDTVLGSLVDRRNLNSTFRNVLDFCDRFFELMAVKGIPEELFWPPLKVPMKVEFQNVLDGFTLKLEKRYGVPVQNGRRFSVPVRVQADGQVRYGYIYTILDNEEWYLEQVRLNLQGLPVEPLPEPEESGKEEDSQATESEEPEESRKSDPEDATKPEQKQEQEIQA